jgi:hypothetical protein
MEKIFFILIIILTIEKTNQTNKTNQTICHTNFDCVETGCCYDSRCNNMSKCQRINKLCYAIVGAGGLIVIALAFLFFWLKVKNTRKLVLELKKLEDKIYSKRKSSNIELLRKLKNNKFS